MSYNYTNGDGVAVLLPAEPNGATEQVSILDQAIRQIKAYLNDPTEGPEAKIDTLTTAVAAPVRVVATHAGGQQISGLDGQQVIEFDTEDLDAAGNFDPVTFKFTAPTAGLYLVSAALTVSKNVSAAPTDIVHQMDIFVGVASGARTKVLRGTVDNVDADMQLTRLFNLSAGQELSVRYTLLLGGGTMTVDVLADPRETVFQVTKLVAT